MATVHLDQHVLPRHSLAACPVLWLAPAPLAAQPGLTRMRCSVVLSLSMPSRALNNSLRCEWMVPGYLVRAKCTTSDPRHPGFKVGGNMDPVGGRIALAGWCHKRALVTLGHNSLPSACLGVGHKGMVQSAPIRGRMSRVKHFWRFSLPRRKMSPKLQHLESIPIRAIDTTNVAQFVDGQQCSVNCPLGGLQTSRPVPPSIWDKGPGQTG